MKPGAKVDVIVCGSLHLDIVVKAPLLPRIDETAVGRTWQKLCGGKGGNQAIQAARAGARTAMIGRVGEDEFGRTLCANLTDSGVDVSGITVDPALGSGMSVAILQDDGDYGAVIVSGSNTAIDPEAVHRQWTSSGGARVLVLQNEVPQSVNLAAARVAHETGAHVILNAAPARHSDKELLDLVNVLVVNRIEAEALFGHPISDRTSARAAMSGIDAGQMSVVITLGGDGLIVAEPSGEITEVPPIKVKVTSTHGAGDCFVGVLASQLSGGVPIREACKVANLEAAAFVSRST